tara:strand:- start:2763 stop:3380 length:618 start_codon:yes stop_codon:yes gene_type:complete
MLRKIKVYGKLRKLLGWENGVYWADVNSTAEVGRFLVANWPHVKKHMIDQFYKVKAGGYEIGEDEIYDPIGQEISIIPIAIGAKKFFSSGIGKFIAGALIVAAVVFVPAAFPVLTIGAGTLATGSIALGIGVSLMISGVIQMLSPQPEHPEGAGEIDPQSNFSFSGVQNVSRAGIPLSLVYGHEVFVGSVVVSNGVDTAQVKGTA